MNKIHKFYVFLIFLQLITTAYASDDVVQGQVTSEPRETGKIYAIQVAASKVYIDPDFFKQKFKLTEEVRYFRKDGWNKYIIGSYKTENEAKKRLSSIKFDAFVTSLSTNLIVDPDNPITKEKPPVSVSSQDNSAALTDTSFVPHGDSLKSLVSVSDSRQTYNQKIRSADSAFNIAKDLVRARRYYQEATLIFPDKNYPKDQIIEIDKLLNQNRSKPVFSSLSLKVLVTWGCPLIGILVLGLLSVRWFRKHRRGRKKATDQPAKKSASAFDPKKQMASSEIMQLYPNLADRLKKLMDEQISDGDFVRHEVERCLNSTDEILRMEAELAWIRLNADDPCAFLGMMKQDFSAWEQLHVFEMIRRNQIKLPDFSRWLNSPNESIVIFSKRMIRAFKQREVFLAEIIEASIDFGVPETESNLDFPSKPDMDLQTAAAQILENRIR